MTNVSEQIFKFILTNRLEWIHFNKLPGNYYASILWNLKKGINRDAYPYPTILKSIYRFLMMYLWWTCVCTINLAIIFNLQDSVRWLNDKILMLKAQGSPMDASSCPYYSSPHAPCFWLEKAIEMAECLETLHTHGQPRQSSWLLPLEQQTPAARDIWGGNQWTEDLSLSSLSKSYLPFQTNWTDLKATCICAALFLSVFFFSFFLSHWQSHLLFRVWDIHLWPLVV